MEVGFLSSSSGCDCWNIKDTSCLRGRKSGRLASFSLHHHHHHHHHHQHHHHHTTTTTNIIFISHHHCSRARFGSHRVLFPLCLLSSPLPLFPPFPLALEDDKDERASPTRIHQRRPLPPPLSPRQLSWLLGAAMASVGHVQCDCESEISATMTRHHPSVHPSYFLLLPPLRPTKNADTSKRYIAAEEGEKGEREREKRHGLLRVSRERSKQSIDRTKEECLERMVVD
ncbi:hypothetical protein BKA81DRAFT_142736 [Phyllosticta paracitricarpa]